ncbi:MAG: DUF4364 family protein [Oscillospiraceae bacterium]|jgi:hypothetical protein|nr:DUF4364 family protein [Oscillospiraceae bacterium]
MPRYGFSGEAPVMRKLILFACQAVGEPVDVRELIKLALLDDNADYFLFSDALAGLLDNGLLERDGECVRLTARGDEITGITERELPAALRRAVIEESAMARDRQMRGRCVFTSVETADGLSSFTGALTDGAVPLLELKLQTGGEKQSAELKRRFEKDAETILQKIWEIMTNNNEPLTTDGDDASSDT